MAENSRCAGAGLTLLSSCASGPFGSCWLIWNRSAHSTTWFKRLGVTEEPAWFLTAPGRIFNGRSLPSLKISLPPTSIWVNQWFFFHCGSTHNVCLYIDTQPFQKVQQHCNFQLSSIPEFPVLRYQKHWTNLNFLFAQTSSQSWARPRAVLWHSSHLIPCTHSFLVDSDSGDHGHKEHSQRMRRGSTTQE